MNIHQFATSLTYGDAISDEMLEVFAVEGTWSNIGHQIRERYRGLLDRITLYLPYRPGERDIQWRRALASLRANEST